MLLLLGGLFVVAVLCVLYLGWLAVCEHTEETTRGAIDELEELRRRLNSHE